MAQVAFRKLDARGSPTLEILVDGRSLTDLARTAEAESASREGKPELAGKYRGLPWDILTTRLLLGEASGIWAVLEADQRRDRVPLLVCECGEPGCWPLMATVEVTSDRVTWRDFRQPHRDDWDHGQLGPFTFERAQYAAALQDALSAGT